MREKADLRLETPEEPFAASLDFRDAILREGRELARRRAPNDARRIGFDLAEGPAAEPAGEATSGKLDLGQLGHATIDSRRVAETDC
jgi:hypothetical protein